MRKPLRYSLLPIFVLCIITHSSAQEGNWAPEDGTFSRPRTLLTPDELDGARERLGEAFFREIYAAVYRDVWNTGIPADSTSTNGRRARARLAKNTAFVLYIDRKVQDGEASALSPAEHETLRQKALQLLNGINPEIESVLGYTEWQWSSKELVDYLIAYDMALGAGIPEEDLAEATSRLQDFAGNFHREATFGIAGLSFFTTVKNNHALMTAAALGMAGAVLNDLESEDGNRRPLNWINTALWNIDNVLWRDNNRLSEPGELAGYAEGPHYMRYAFLNLLPFFRTLRNVLPGREIDVSFGNTSRTISHPFHDPNYAQLYEWIARIRTPDGLMPPLEDTFLYEGFPELALTGRKEYVFPVHTPRTTLVRELNSTVDMRAAFFAAGITPSADEQRSVFQALPLAGNLVMRNSWDSSAFYLGILAEHGTARTGGGGHNQADVSSFNVFVGSEMMGLDPGYGQYAIRDSVGKAPNHNMILVDGEGPEIGIPGSAGDADALITDAFALPGMQFGSVETSYRGADIQRNSLLLRDRYAVIADMVHSEESHEYTWLCHGNGLLDGGDSLTGTATWDAGQSEMAWQRNGKTMSVHVSHNGTGPGPKPEENVHEERYNVLGRHTVLANRQQGKSTLFLAGILPDAISSHLDFESGGEEYQQTLVSRAGGEHDVIFAQRDTNNTIVSGFNTSLPENLLTDATLIACSVDPLGEAPPSLLMMKDGSTLEYGRRQLVSATTRTTLGVVRTAPGEYSCYMRDSGWIFIIMDEAFGDVVGDNVSSWNMLWATGRLAVHLNSGGYFRVTATSSAPQHRSQKTGYALTASYPDHDTIRFRISPADSPATSIAVYDITGHRIRTINLDGKAEYLLTTGEFSSGTYVAALLGAGNTMLSTAKFVVQGTFAP